MKVKTKPVVKYDETDKYVFVNGVAKVPGTSMTITLLEFNDIKRKMGGRRQ